MTTHINAYFQEFETSIAAAKGAISAMEKAKDALQAKLAGDDPTPATPPADASPAAAGEAAAKTGKVKYK